MDDTPAHEQLNAQLDAQRERRDMTWREVAAELSMSPQNLSRIRNGEISVSREARRKIDKFLTGDPPSTTSPPATAADPADNWTPEEVERIAKMSAEQITAEGRMIGRFSGEEAQLRFLRKAAEVWLERRGNSVTPPL